jgi:DNA polymerase III delta subunit
MIGSVLAIDEDIDLLILLTVLARHLQNLYFLKPGKGKTVENLTLLGV